MSVHYKFKSALKYDTITFDGLHISVKDLKREILHQKQIGKTGDFDLQITNAQTNEVYQDENALIPKNASLIVVRVPLTVQQKRAWDRQETNQQIAGLKNINTNIPPFVENQDPTAQKHAKAVDLSALDASEDAKILAMMTQSTQEYDPINYARIRGTTQVGEVPSNYRCFKCHQAGHWIKDCRLNTNQENQPEIRKSTGIPRSFMVTVEGPSVPGAMITPSGQFAVPSIDQQAYLEGKKPSLPSEDTMEKVTVPEDLICSICKDLLTDTVMIPCCGSSFCDECIRTALLESENHQCPDCKEIGISPDTMIPNRYLRKNVDNFLNTTGYQRFHQSRSLAPAILPPGNSLVQVPLIQSQPILSQPIQSLGSRAPRPPEIINLVESRSDTDSPIHVHSDQPKSNVRLPLNKNPIVLTNPNLPSKGGDIGRGHPSELNRRQYSQRDRSSTPTVDERIPASLPDTSVPPPVATYAITSLGGNPPAFAGPPPGYGGYGRAPLPYPNMGPGPVTGPGSNYPENRREPRQGYRNTYNRGGRNGRMHGGYRDDRNDRHPPDRNTSDRHPPDRNPPQLGIDDPLSAFEKILREKDMARERRRRKRSMSRSPSPRPRSRSRTRSPPPMRKRASVSPSPPARQRSLTPPVRARGSRTPSPLPPRHRTPPRNKPHARSRTRSRSRSPPPPPPRQRGRSFSISRSRSRSFSRTPERSPRDRHFSPKRREGSRFRSPLQGRNSPPQRYGGRNYKEYEGGQYYEDRGRARGRTRGYTRGGRTQDSPSRYENRESRYEDRSSRNYQQPSQPRPDSGASSSTRYSNRRYDNYSDTVPPGTEPMDYDRYRNDYNEPRGAANLPTERESKRDRELRDAVARDWERTRDREIEQRERERMKDYDEYHRPSFRKSSSPDKARKRAEERSHERGKENKHSEGHDGSSREKPIEVYRDHSHKTMDSFKNQDTYKTADRERPSVLVDLKKEPSVEKEKKKEDMPTPVKDKKKDKEKKKRKKEDGDKKEKKKKRKEKKEILEKAKSEENIVRVTEAKPIVIAQNVLSKIEDPLYGDIEGTTVDKEVVENYGKSDPLTNEVGNIQAADQLNVSESNESKENVVLAVLPELSKWELDDELPGQDDKMSGDDPSNSSDKKIVTSEVLKRAENAIFLKALNAIRPIDVGKKPTLPEKVPEKDKKEKKDTKDAPVKEEPLEEPITLSPEETENSREARKVANSIQITIPSHQPKIPERSVEVAVTAKSTDITKIQSRSEKTKLASVPIIPSSPVRLSAKERLGAKVDTDREETRRVRSTVEQKSRSKSPKRYFERNRDKPRDISPGGRRVVVGSSWSRDKDRDENKRERRVSESSKSMEKRYDKGFEREKDRRKEKDKKSGSPSRETKHRKDIKPEKIVIRKKDDKTDERLVTVKISEPQEGLNKKIRKNPKLSSDRKRSVLDEANFEPDYDESEPDSLPEVPGEEKTLLVNVTLNQVSPTKKRSRSPSENKEKKKLKTDINVIDTLEKTLKEKPVDKDKKLETEDSSGSDSSSDTSSDSSIERKKHRKKKKSKKRRKKKAKKRKNSSSDSDSSDSSSSDSDTGKKKKKHKHRKKSSKSKKRKKSKHK